MSNEIDEPLRALLVGAVSIMHLGLSEESKGIQANYAELCKQHRDLIFPFLVAEMEKLSGGSRTILLVKPKLLAPVIGEKYFRLHLAVCKMNTRRAVSKFGMTFYVIMARTEPHDSISVQQTVLRNG